MLGRRILVAAVLVYLAVAGWIGLAGRGSGNRATADQTTTISTTGSSDDAGVTGLADISNLKPYCAIAMQLQRADWVEQYKKTLDDIADSGADTVSMIIDTRMENYASTHIYLDERKTMPDDKLHDLILYAKSRNLRVILMPIVLLDDDDDQHWRGTIKPQKKFPEDKPPGSDESWHAWFDSYRNVMEHYGYIANDTGVDVLVIGSELVSSEQHLDEWIDTIRDLRTIFKGQLTYSSNWDRYEKVPFWKYLDFVGMNSYWKLGDDEHAQVPDIEKNWADIQDQIFEFQKKVHKPVILLEAGWCSLANAATDSWDYTQDTLDKDDQLQARLYTAFFQSWWGKPQLAGFVMWEFHPGPDESGKGYTPQGKPAEETLRLWLRKPRWNIMQTP